MPRLHKKSIFDATYWEQGYFDLWSIIHCLSGALWAFLPFLITISPLQAFIISASLLIAWEIIEVFKNVLEPLSNRLIDILVGVVGYWILFGIIRYLDLTPSVIWATLVTSALLTFLLSAFAWFSYSKYKNSFKRVRGKIVKVKRNV